MTTKAQILRSILTKCIDCSGGSKREAALCVATKRELWPFRMGRDPNPKKAVGFGNRTRTRVMSAVHPAPK